MKRRTFLKSIAATVGFLSLGKISFALPKDNDEPKPPGTICPMCGSPDLDLEDGKLVCNNCHCEAEIIVRGYIDYFDSSNNIPLYAEMRVLNRGKAK